MSKYRKFLVAAATVVLAGVLHVYGANNAWVQLVVSVAGALGVYVVKNEA